MSDYDPDRPSGTGMEPIDPGVSEQWNPAPIPPPQPRSPYPYAPDNVGPQNPRAPYSPPPYSPPPYPDARYPASPYPGAQYPGAQYPAAQYPGAQYPGAQYPGAQYPGAHYPAAGSSPYATPNAGWHAGRPRPGQVLATAVLGYIEAGLLILGALFLFAGASAVDTMAQATGSYDQSATTQFLLNGLANLVAAGLLIAGAVTMTGGKRSGRTMIAVATAIVAAEALYWILQFHEAGLVVWAFFFLSLPVIALVLAFTREVGAWLTAHLPVRP